MALFPRSGGPPQNPFGGLGSPGPPMRNLYKPGPYELGSLAWQEKLRKENLAQKEAEDRERRFYELYDEVERDAIAAAKKGILLSMNKLIPQELRPAFEEAYANAVMSARPAAALRLRALGPLYDPEVELTTEAMLTLGNMRRRMAVNTVYDRLAHMAAEEAVVKMPQFAAYFHEKG